MSDKIIRIEGVSHFYGSVEVLQNLWLEIERGEFVALVGPSGCGKTTLLNLLSGFYKPTLGNVFRSGTTRVVHQQDGLFPWLTVSENILFGMRDERDKAARQSQLDDLIYLIGLENFAQHYPHQLSGGMRQRVELVRALTGNSDLLLMDEPFSALDYQTRLHMRRELVHLLTLKPRTVVFVTHDIEEAAQLADRVIALSARPARLFQEMFLNLERPRDPTHPVVIGTIDRILDQLGLRNPVQPRTRLTTNETVL